jgi:hypothetical protein
MTCVFFYVHVTCTRRPQSLPSPPSCSRSSKKMVARVPKLIPLLKYSSSFRLKKAAAAGTATSQHPKANTPAKQQLLPGAQKVFNSPAWSGAPSSTQLKFSSIVHKQLQLLARPPARTPKPKIPRSSSCSRCPEMSTTVPHGV